MTDSSALRKDGLYRDLDSLWAQVDGDNLSDDGVCIRCLYRVLANSYKMESYSEAITALLLVGLRRFEMGVALLSHPISNQIHELQAFAGKGNELYLGQHITVRTDLCHRVHETNKILSVDKIEPLGSGLEYGGFSVASYLGLPVTLKGEKAGILSFIGESVRLHGFSQEDVSILRLIAEGVACMAELQATQSQRKKTDLAMFASGSIKSLEEYLEQAKLPNFIGVASRVVEALKKRIGESSLSIGCIAEDLNLSKRTLQRRLYQHDISFAELRDQVRFHYSIDYLIRQHMSIDGISVCLDFSDRTSFTNAFKRWTGLSPSTFRKVFRDYI